MAGFPEVFSDRFKVIEAIFRVYFTKIFSYDPNRAISYFPRGYISVPSFLFSLLRRALVPAQCFSVPFSCSSPSGPEDHFLGETDRVLALRAFPPLSF